MQKRMKIIIISAACLLTLCLTVVLGLVFGRPKVEVTQNGSASIEVFGQYLPSEAKSYVRVLGIEFGLDTKTQGTVDPNKVGEYKVTHSAEFMGKKAEKTVAVKVVDTVAPSIEVDEDNFNFEFTDTLPTPDDVKVGFTATDNYDGDISGKVEKRIDGNICYLTVVDSSGNYAEAKINVIYTDGLRPTITLNGDTTVYIKVGTPYIENGFTAVDNLAGDLTASVAVNGNPDTNKSGIYLIEYTVSDAAGNSARVTRRVVVYGNSDPAEFQTIAPNGKTVYLTFDDGPGVYTEKLLGYLRQYDIKATFFVTNQFSKYQNLIGTAYRDGHTIGVHTYSHNIYKKNGNIYASVEAFMADFNSMQEVIKAQTGSYTNIFRFPGGTNNTISRSHCQGIMTELSNKLLAEGYYYFDWNCDSMDTSSAKNADAVIKSTIEQISSKENSVVLMHDIKDYTVEAIPGIIEYGLRKGYTFKALDPTSPAIRFKPQN